MTNKTYPATEFKLHGDQIDTASRASSISTDEEGVRVSILHVTPLLVSKASKGNLKYWQGFVVFDPDTEDVFTRTVSFQETKSGLSSPNTSTPKKIEGKNIGKSNETTPEEQAISEIESHAARQEDKGYWVYGEDKPETLPLPMLAHSFTKRGHDIEWPAFVQPKLDGVRMLFDGAKGWSRKGKLFIQECIEHLRCTLPDNVILDGELMLDHREYTFQETMQAIKKFRPNVTPDLQYHVYDVLLTDRPNASFEERWMALNVIARDSGFGAIMHYRTGLGIRAAEPVSGEVNIYTVSTNEAFDETGMREWHKRFIIEGYEGTMLRNKDSEYKIKNRSADLQKVKDFEEEEFEIVDYTEGSGKDAGTVIFVCKSHHYKQDPNTNPGTGHFSVRPRGTDQQRRAWYRQGQRLIGSQLTVRFQGLSDDGIPRFPVGINVRDEDLQG